MPALMIREDGSPADPRRLAKSEDDRRVARRLLAIAVALDGMSREAAARIAGMDRQTLTMERHDAIWIIGAERILRRQERAMDPVLVPNCDAGCAVCL